MVKTVRNAMEDIMNKKCIICGKEFKVKPSEVDRRKFCSNKCVGKYNSLTRKKRVTKVCQICGKEYEVTKSRETKSVTCSTLCQNKWQSNELVGQKANNYKGGDGKIKCKTCGREYSVPHAIMARGTSKFCSVECKQKYWTENVQCSSEFRANQLAANEKQWKSDSFRKLVRETAIKTLGSYKNKRETSIEKKIRVYLESNNITNIPQHNIHNKFCVDFYLPDTNTIIEAFGDYWHANPLYYGNEKKPLNNTQLGNVKRDRARLAYFHKCGYKVWVIWETDINSKLETIMNFIAPPRD